jgi:photosystem II stability/assembly factor-like uncharacterized protein
VLLSRQAPGQPWKIARRTLDGYHVCTLTYVQSTGVLFAGTHNGGVAISLDAGASWTFKNKGLGSTNIYSLAHAGSGSTLKIYAGTEPAALYVSDDLGENWRELTSLTAVPSAAQWNFPSPPHIAHVKHIGFAPNDPNHIYASIEQGELLSSPDGGVTWHELLRNADAPARCDGDAHRAIVRSSKPNEIFLPTGCGLLHSYDKGQSWADESARITPIGYPDVTVFDPERQDVLFIAGARSHPGDWFADLNAAAKIARSRDGGASWQIVVNGLPETSTANFEAMTLEASGGKCAVFVGTTAGDVYCSENDGESWSKIAGDLPPISKGGHFGILSGAFH